VAQTTTCAKSTGPPHSFKLACKLRRHGGVEVALFGRPDGCVGVSPSSRDASTAPGLGQLLHMHQEHLRCQSRAV
jgi:hypothetical protein